MYRFVYMPALFLVVCAALAQTAGRLPSSGAPVIWEPPPWSLREYPKATVSKELVAKLRVSSFPISLEHTKMEDARSTLGGTLGQKGDAGDYDEWLCFYGTDHPGGRWVLWLESGEIDGGTVGGFQWHRLNANAVIDRRCQMLGEAEVELPIALRLGMGEAEVLKNLGRPTVRHGDRLFFLHEHQESIHGEPYDSSNLLAIVLRDGRVWEIEVSKSTTS